MKLHSHSLLPLTTLQRCESFIINPSKSFCFFYLISLRHLDPLIGGKEPENFLNLQKSFCLKMMFWIVLITSFTQIDLHYNHKSTRWWLCNQGWQVGQILPTMWPHIPMFHWLNYNICPYMIKYISLYPIIHKNFYFFWKKFFLNNYLSL